MRRNATPPTTRPPKMRTLCRKGPESWFRDVPACSYPTLARVGAAVVEEDVGGPGLIVIVRLNHCIVQYADGSRRRLRWNQVMLDNVRPDPLWVGRGSRGRRQRRDGVS